MRRTRGRMSVSCLYPVSIHALNYYIRQGCIMTTHVCWSVRWCVCLLVRYARLSVISRKSESTIFIIMNLGKDVQNNKSNLQEVKVEV